MIYLAFILATGAYVFLGTGGPLHSDNWLAALRRRVAAIEPESWLLQVLLVLVPSAAFTLLYAFAIALAGDVAILLLGGAALFFSFGRADLPAMMARFDARCNVDDLQGAAMVVADVTSTSDVDGEEALGRSAERAFLQEGAQRWFAPVLYFLLLGPFFAVAYRLLSWLAENAETDSQRWLAIADWLPSRLLVITFGIVGNFEAVRPWLGQAALDSEVSSAEFLVEGAERVMPESGDDPLSRSQRAAALLQRSQYVWVAVASVLAIVM